MPPEIITDNGVVTYRFVCHHKLSYPVHHCIKSGLTIIATHPTPSHAHGLMIPLPNSTSISIPENPQPHPKLRQFQPLPTEIHTLPHVCATCLPSGSHNISGLSILLR